jgi:hypothetical protein
MSLYNRYFQDYDSASNGGKDDFYHGEYDDETVYGKLYIPHMESNSANFEFVKKTFLANNIGLVTHATFTVLEGQSTYKGKNKKQLFSAYVYVKWFNNNIATALQQHIIRGNKKLARVNVDKTKDIYWIVRPNTVISDELMSERIDIHELRIVAENVAHSVLEEEYDDDDMDILYELKRMATCIAMRVLD